MSGFKDMVMRDRDILLNPDELGEQHDIDGTEIVCVIDDMGLNQGEIDFSPLSKSQRTIFAKCEDLPRKRGYGTELMVDGVPYIVQSWDEDMGMATVVLSINVNS
ncbi:MAG: hypothetical protein NC231_12195 [Bacillus sp. (in: Bacteria)]|nr:hypothetical protein [Bacillus sp. (in: firmicutes)]MCM1427124.1 sugar ABC transporter ATP-binding protein [Eubacterium sp.]